MRADGAVGQPLIPQAAVLAAVVLFLVLSWASTARMERAITQSAIEAYQQTEMEIVRGIARGIEAYVEAMLQPGRARPVELVEQEVFRRFVDPVRLLSSGDAWIYSPVHVIYEPNSDFPEEYRQRSMAAIFEIQKRKGASHYEEMVDAVMKGRPGTGWYVWLPEKGMEIAAWTPVRVGSYLWSVGVSTPLPEILESTDAGAHIRSSRALMGAATALTAALLAIWALAEARRHRSDALTVAQKDLSLGLGSLPTLDDCLRLCAEAAARLSRADTAGIYLPDPQTGTLSLRCSVRAGHSCVMLPLHMADGEGVSHGGTLVTVPVRHGERTLGLLAASRPEARTPPYALRALEAVAAVLGGAITRRHMEESLREGEERFRSVVDTAPDAIVTADPAQRVAFWSRAAERTFLWKEGEAVGMPLAAFLAPAAEEAGSMRREGIRRDGSRFPADVASARWSSYAGVHATYVIRDMSRHESAEREKRELEQKLQRAQRMESLGILAGGVAHDLSNLLAPVVSYAELLFQDVAPDSPLRESLLELRRAGERAGAVVQDLLTLGRRGSYRMAPLDMNAVASEFLSSPVLSEARQRNPGVSVEDRLQPDLPPIAGSAPHLTKALLNLVLNAFEAMPQGGRITLATRGRILEEPLTAYERIEPGSYAVLEVSDTGTGIEGKDLERIFEPFYTKKTMGRSGSGLGLAVVYGVVHDHQGRIDVRTEVGRGSCFSLWFPATGERPEARGGGEPELKGVETVLLVEDQPEQRAVTSRLLERYGYKVRTAVNGRAAVELLRIHPVDILVLDMILEDDFDGLDCWREVLKIRPDQSAVIVSGYAETARVKEVQRLGAGAFLRKPFTLDALAQAMRRELSKRKPGP